MVSDKESENKSQGVPASKSTKKWWVFSIIGLVALAIMGGIWKGRKDEERKITLNRNLAYKYCAIGKPLDVAFTENVDLDLLQMDPAATSVLKLYKHKKAAKEALSLGSSASSVILEAVDFELLKEESESGNQLAKEQLELLEHRESLFNSVQLGKPIPNNLSTEINFSLLERDARAGNNAVQKVLELYQNRKRSEALCVLGKPFDLNFYQEVDRSLLREDGKAGYAPAKEILKLADNRIKIAELTIVSVPYKESFFIDVDKDLLIKDADAGNADSQYAWARLLGRDNVVKRDFVKSVKYYKLAANQNHAPALTNLGQSYSAGEGVEKDPEKFLELTKKAVDLNYPLAMSNLGHTYLRGSIVDRDTEKGMELMQRSADLNCAGAHSNLGAYYHMGQYGYKRDMEKAELYYRKALAQHQYQVVPWLIGVIQSKRPVSKYQVELTEVYETGALGGDHHSEAMYGLKLMWGNGVKMDHKKGIKWLRKSADAGHVTGQFRLAMMYSRGRGVKQNFPEAVRLHKLAAAQGSSFAMDELGIIYCKGKEGVVKDNAQAVKYLQMAVDRGYTFNAVYLANLYILGDGVPKEVEKGLKILESEAKRNNHDALNLLGVIYLKGEIVDQDPAKGVAYYKQGVKVGSTWCMTNLGYNYLSGEHIARDEAEALNLFRMAMNKKDARGTYQMAKIHEEGLCGVKKNIPEAIDLYSRVAKEFEPAKEALERLQKEIKK